MALMLGAKHVTTIDYVNLSSEDPRITVLHATEFNAKFLRNELPEFDAIISYSSLEHSGLGRYVHWYKCTYCPTANLKQYFLPIFLHLLKIIQKNIV